MAMRGSMDAESDRQMARRVCSRSSWASWATCPVFSAHLNSRLRHALETHLLHLASGATGRSKKRGTPPVQPSHSKRRKSGKGSPKLTGQPSAAGQHTTQPPLGVKLLQAASSCNINKLQQLVQQQGVDVNQPHAPPGRTALQQHQHQQHQRPAKGQSHEAEKYAAQQQLQLDGTIKQPQKQQQQSRARSGQLPSCLVRKANSSSSTLLVSSTSSQDYCGALTAAGTLQRLPSAPVALA